MGFEGLPPQTRFERLPSCVYIVRLKQGFNYHPLSSISAHTPSENLAKTAAVVSQRQRLYPTRRLAGCFTTTDSVQNTLALDPSVPIPAPFRSYLPSRSLNLYLKLSQSSSRRNSRMTSTTGEFGDREKRIDFSRAHAV